MPIFELGDESIVPVEQTSFASTGHRERDDLQRILRDQIEVVASDVLIIAEEFGEWSDSRRRIDLLGIDKKANLVVIELKRTDDGGHMELQALRYSGMISTLTAKQAIEAYDNYLSTRNIGGDAEQRLLEFLDWSEIDEDSFGQDVRIVLVSANFSRELTTAVIWLNDKDLDIRCVRIRPYEYDGKTLIDVQQVIPLPETADYQIQVREKKRQDKEGRYYFGLPGIATLGDWQVKVLTPSTSKPPILKRLKAELLALMLQTIQYSFFCDKTAQKIKAGVALRSIGL